MAIKFIINKIQKIITFLIKVLWATKILNLNDYSILKIIIITIILVVIHDLVYIIEKCVLELKQNNKKE